MESAENNKYANGKIYRISCNITGLCYVGSTTKTLSQRLRRHEYDYKAYLNGTYGYVTSYEILKNDDYQITLLQSYPCENNQELLAREGWYQKKYWDRSVNKILNGKTGEEKKMFKQESDKQYYQDNKEKINKSKKTKVKCDCGGKFTKTHNARHMKSTKHQNWLNE